MSMLTVRNLPDEVKRALKARAAQRHRSMEAEVRDILTNAVNGPERARLGSLLADVGRKAGLQEDDVAVFDAVRDDDTARGANFS